MDVFTDLMASGQQPLIYNNEGAEGHVQNAPVDPNIIVVVPVVSQDQGSNPMMSESQSCQNCSYQSEQVSFTHRPSPSHDRVDEYFENDNPTCLYLCAAFSLFAPIIGIFIIFIFALWRPRSLRRGTRKRSAFGVLCISTLMGSIFSFLMGWELHW